MKEIKESKFGKIIYEEGFWSGKKTITIGDTILTNVSKTEFEYEENGEKVKVELIGNFFTGISLKIKEEIVEITPKTKWYETTFAILPFIFDMIWGNVPALCSIFPIVGGAIGGAMTALGGILILNYIKKTSLVKYKILIGIGGFVATILACFLIALIILVSFA